MSVIAEHDDLDTLARLDAEVSSPAAPARRHSRGAQILDEARRFYQRYYHFPSSAQLDAFTLWTAGLTHLRDHNHRYIGPTAARLLVRASTPGAGKTLLAEFIELTGGRGKVMFSPATTEWGAVRAIAEGNACIVLDNYDEAKGAKRDGQLNLAIAGAYRKSSLYQSGRKNEEEAYVYGPLAITAIGDALRRRTDFRPVEERSVVLDVAKAPRHVKLARFDDRDPETMARVRAIHAACADWGRAIAPVVAVHRPADLAELDVDPRVVQMWEPMISIADQAGGEWPERARRALRVMAMGEALPDDDDADPFARLTPAERTMVDASHVMERALDDARLAAIDAGVEEEDDLPTSVSMPSAKLFEAMAKLPGGERWKIPQGSDRERVFKARTMALSEDLAMFGVIRSSVKVPANDGTGRFINGWFSSDILPHRRPELPHHRPADLDAHARQVEEDDLPFE